MSAPGALTERLLAVMARLRTPGAGCPWDLEQSFASIAPYTVEEAYEVAEAIRLGDLAALREELGDLLFQVVFHARMAEEAGAFSFADVVADLSAKMVRRHPHVFGAADIADADAQTRAWEDHKAAEREARARAAGREPSVLDGVTLALPALMRAIKLQNRAARVGFDWPDKRQVLDKLAEELGELQREIDEGTGADRLEDEVGDILFVLANLGRHLGVDPEAALRRTNGKFERRFRAVEQRLVERGRRLQDSNLAEMDALWDEVKRAEKPG